MRRENNPKTFISIPRAAGQCAYQADEYRVLALSLTKNTNILSCILQSQSAAPLDTDDFRLELTARNGCMDHRNTPTDSVFTCYLPFMQESANLEDIQVVHAGMNTLRLMENDDTRLRLIYQPSGKRFRYSADTLSASVA